MESRGLIEKGAAGIAQLHKLHRVNNGIYDAAYSPIGIQHIVNGKNDLAPGFIFTPELRYTIYTNIC